jgi:NitT/TauT family transport system substrate-binding protein
MQSSSVLPFVRGVVDVASAMYYNEYHKLIEAGIREEDLNTFMFSKHGLDFPEDGIYTTTEFRKAHPDICQKVIRAVHKGWKYSFEHEQETIQAIIRTATDKNFNTNSNHQKWMIKAMKKLIPIDSPRNLPWGYLTSATYSNVCKILEHQNLLKNAPPEYGDFYQPVVNDKKPAEGGSVK